MIRLKPVASISPDEGGRYMTPATQMDFINETWKGREFYLAERSACRTASGQTALPTVAGWT